MGAGIRGTLKPFKRPTYAELVAAFGFSFDIVSRCDASSGSQPDLSGNGYNLAASGASPKYLAQLVNAPYQGASAVADSVDTSGFVYNNFGAAPLWPSTDSFILLTMYSVKQLASTVGHECSVVLNRPSVSAVPYAALLRFNPSTTRFTTTNRDNGANSKNVVSLAKTNEKYKGLIRVATGYDSVGAYFWQIINDDTMTTLAKGTYVGISDTATAFRLFHFYSGGYKSNDTPMAFVAYASGTKVDGASSLMYSKLRKLGWR